MTMPHLENCRHDEDGWCLTCVKEQWEELQRTKEELQQVRIIYKELASKILELIIDECENDDDTAVELKPLLERLYMKLKNARK